MIKTAVVWMLLLTLALPGSVVGAYPVKEQAMTRSAHAVHKSPISTTRLLTETPESTHSSGQEIDQSELKAHPFAHDVILIDVGHGGIDGGTSYGEILEKILIWPFHGDCSCAQGRLSCRPEPRCRLRA